MGLQQLQLYVGVGGGTGVGSGEAVGVGVSGPPGVTVGDGTAGVLSVAVAVGVIVGVLVGGGGSWLSTGSAAPNALDKRRPYCSTCIIRGGRNGVTG